MTKSIGGAGTFTFGPTYVQIGVNDTAGCLTGITVTRHDENHASATDPLKTGHWWDITAAPSGCSGFSVDLTLPTDFTPDATGLDQVCYYTGTGTVWNCAWSANGPHSITRNGVTHFSEWAVGRNPDPTAVGLRSFRAAVSPGTAGPFATVIGLTLAGLVLFAHRATGRR